MKAMTAADLGVSKNQEAPNINPKDYPKAPV